jgi:hypothetical protein
MNHVVGIGYCSVLRQQIADILWHGSKQVSDDMAAGSSYHLTGQQVAGIRSADGSYQVT